MKKKNFTDFYEAYHFCREHPFFNIDILPCSIDVEVVKVHPKLNCIVDNPSKNTKTKVWMEWGPIVINGKDKIISYSHDIDLDVGADTYEEAIIKLANAILKKYGYYDTMSDIFDSIQEAFLQARHFEINDPDKLIDLQFGKKGWKKALDYYNGR